MLYLTGGLVLGETMALWMTVKQEFFMLAAVLLVFSCACTSGFVRGRGRGKRRQPAFFVWIKCVWGTYLTGSVTVGAVVVVCAGMTAGIWRMEAEQAVIRRETALVESLNGMAVDVEGRVMDIGETDYGYRLILKDCSMIVKTEVPGHFESYEENAGQENDTMVRRMHAYVKSADGLKIGQKIKVKGEVEVLEPDRNPGQFDFQSYCFAKGICGSFSGDVVMIVDPRFLVVKETLRQIGLVLEHRLEAIAAEEDLGILKAVLLGEKRDMDDEVYKMYQKNGISHVLAISGLHVSVIGMGLWNGLRKLGAGYWASGAAAFGMLFCFGSIAGFGPSVVRAVFMMGISFVAGIFGRTYDLPSAMCVSGMGLLLWNPYVLTQASFQLSFLAVFAIFFPGAYLAKTWRLQGFLQNIWTSVSIQLVTLPVVLYHSFEVPVFGLILNLVVVPLMTYVLVSGILALAGSFLWLQLGMLLLGGAHYILAFYRWICEWVSMVTGSYLVLGRPPFGTIAVYYGCLAAGVWMAAGNFGRMASWLRGERWRSGKKGKSIAEWKRMGIVTGMIVWMAGTWFLVPRPVRGLMVTFLDVGQGDGILVETEGRTLLVDCGSSQEKNVGADCLVPFLKSRGISHLDVAAVTHGDQDHISGIRELLEDPECEISVGHLVMPVSGIGDEACEKLAGLAAGKGIPVYYMDAEHVELYVPDSQTMPDKHEYELKREIETEKPESAGEEVFGDEIPFWQEVLGTEVYVDCLYPLSRSWNGASDRNNGSLVLRLQYRNFSMLLTGDVEKEGELEMVHRGAVEPVTVLKAAHHGSATSTAEPFLEAVRPAYVVFSYGEGNRYGHPAADVVERCEALGAKIRKTAECGAVTIRTDGKKMQISGWLDRKNGI